MAANIGVTQALITNWLKVQYIDTDEINKQLVDGSMSPVYKDFATEQKTEMTEGKSWSIPQWGSQKRTSGKDFSVVQARNRAGSTGRRLVLVHSMAENFDEVDIDRQAMLASKTNVGTFFATLKSDIDQSVMSMNQDILTGIYGGNQDGKLASVSAVNGALTVVTISDSATILRFEEGQYVEFAAAIYDGTNDLRRVSGTDKAHKITAVDHAKKQITFATAITALAADDKIYKEGEYIISDDSKKLYGFLDYIPATIPANDSFLGINRQLAPARLAGYYVQPSAPNATQDKGEVIYNEIVKAMVQVSKNFPMYKITKIVANPQVLQELQLSKVFKNGVRWINDNDEKRRTGTIGFSAFNVLSPKGDVPLVFDSFCPEDEIIGYNAMSWKIRYLAESAGKVVNFKEEKGSRVLLSRTHNTNVVFLESYHFLCSMLPGSNFRINLANVL